MQARRPATRLPVVRLHPHNRPLHQLRSRLVLRLSPLRVRTLLFLTPRPFHLLFLKTQTLHLHPQLPVSARLQIALLTLHLLFL